MGRPAPDGAGFAVADAVEGDGEYFALPGGPEEGGGGVGFVVFDEVNGGGIGGEDTGEVVAGPGAERVAGGPLGEVVFGVVSDAVERAGGGEAAALAVVALF